MRTTALTCLAVAAFALAMRGALAEPPGNMIGRQSQNTGLRIVPAPGPVTVDGKLDDWDFSGRICVFADRGVRSRYSTEVGAMWRDDAIYIAVKWRDPTPMFNTVDPNFNPETGWVSDSMQLRVSTSDQTSWITTWYYTPRKQPVFHHVVWKDRASFDKGTTTRVHVAPEEGGVELSDGLEMAYLEGDDGQSYVQELRIPLHFIYKSPPVLQEGVAFRLGFEFLWGDPTGNTWPVHRYADNLQPGKTSREFFWSDYKIWGDATIHGSGNLEPLQYVSQEKRIAGTIPIRVEVPKDAARLTLVVENEDGERIRNLAGDLSPEDYAVAQTDSRRTVEVMWDGRDDKKKLVAPGTYRVRGLHHDGLGAEYESCFYNPGTPPWPTASGAGAWGADHCPPLHVARAGGNMVVSWQFAEGGSGIIGIGSDGLKKWGEKRGARMLAADEEHVYAVPAGWHIKSDVMIRLDARTGAYAPFVRDGKPLSFELPFADILARTDLRPVDLAVAGDYLVVLLKRKAKEGEDDKSPSHALAVLDKRTAELAKLIDAQELERLASVGESSICASDGAKLYRLDIKTGDLQAISCQGLGKPGAIAGDNAGNVVVMDLGPDYQIKAFAMDGRQVYTCAKRGGRPIRGDFDPQAVSHVSSVAVDADGQVWVVENWDYPRRVSVFNPEDGALVRDYIGNTGYAGTGCFLHDSNPDLAYVGPVELRRDPATRTWKVARILWVPDRAAGETFEVSAASHTQPQRFTATVKGKAREYLFVPGYGEAAGHKLFMETDTGWRPVCAITTVGEICGIKDGQGGTGEAPTGEFAGLDVFDAVFWNDANEDGKVQRGECEIVQPDKPRNAQNRRSVPIPLSCGWGARMTPDFTFYVDGIARYRPTGFTDAGAPIFGSRSLEMLPVRNQGDLVPVPGEDALLCLSSKGYPGRSDVLGIDTVNGTIRWRYPNPYPGVHGSHRAPMPSPGMLIGPLKIVGVVPVNDSIGSVFVMRGNLGQDFFMTTDGLFVAALFEDGRLPGETLPANEADLAGRPMEGFSHGGEPFNGWFGKQADGKIRMTTGFPRQAAMVLQVKGLEKIQRLAPVDVVVDAAMLARADADNQARAAAAAGEKTLRYTIESLAAPTIDGMADEWGDVPKAAIGRAGDPNTAAARLAYDSDMLYMLFEVEDESPWKNKGKDFRRLFKTGDAVDVQLSPSANVDHEPRNGDLRIVIANLDGQPAAILMQPKSAAGPSAEVEYVSPIGTRRFDRVERIDGAKVAVARRDGRYTVEAGIPLAAIGVAPTGKLTGDLGVIRSDADGTVNMARAYWSNKKTNLVNDEPAESWLTPSEWGELKFR